LQAVQRLSIVVEKRAARSAVGKAWRKRRQAKVLRSGWNGFGFPDSIEDVMCVRGNCYGSYRR
jgi:hypothetical protein